MKRAHYNYYNRGGKKAANYYSKNREVVIEKVTNRYRNLSEKEAKREYQGGRYSHKYWKAKAIPKRLLWFNEDRKIKY